jgi:hypothetical protein
MVDLPGMLECGGEMSRNQEQDPVGIISGSEIRHVNLVISYSRYLYLFSIGYGMSVYHDISENNDVVF